jgi:hypothetical protein
LALGFWLLAFGACFQAFSIPISLISKINGQRLHSLLHSNTAKSYESQAKSQEPKAIFPQSASSAKSAVKVLFFASTAILPTASSYKPIAIC